MRTRKLKQYNVEKRMELSVAAMDAILTTFARFLAVTPPVVVKLPKRNTCVSQV